MTGQQGDVMKESMKVSSTVAWNLIPLKIKNKIHKDMEENEILEYGIVLKNDSKRWSFSRCCYYFAFVSLLCGIKVTNKAVTGEIDLNGSIHEMEG